MAVKRRKSAEGPRRRTLVKSGFGVYFVIFLIFIYGPMFAMFILSFQGKRGGTSFPMRGVSLYWWEKLIEPSTVGDMKGALLRSIILALIVMVITALFSTMLGMAFRRPFRGSGTLFYTIMAGLMVPGILLSLGLATLLKQVGIPPDWWSSGLGVHVVWTLPFGFLVMMAVFNRFDSSLEEAARDMGASEWTVFREVTLPLILPGIVAAGLFGFTLSYDEFARTTLLAGELNTLPPRHQRLDDAADPADPVRPRDRVHPLLAVDDRPLPHRLHHHLPPHPLDRLHAIAPHPRRARRVGWSDWRSVIRPDGFAERRSNPVRSSVYQRDHALCRRVARGLEGVVQLGGFPPGVAIDGGATSSPRRRGASRSTASAGPQPICDPT